MLEEQVTRFIGEPITVEHDNPPYRQKVPTCPDRFIWAEERFAIRANTKEWQDFQRRGKMKRNMQPQHARRAAQTGSWGVGKFYFRVETTDSRVFDLYYDRSPKNADDRLGQWFLYREWVDEL
jgi:hypothetical protein